MNIIDKLEIARAELEARAKDYEKGTESYIDIIDVIDKLEFLIKKPTLLGEIKESEIIHIENYDDEVWKPYITGDEVYEVSNKMRIRNLATNNLLKLCLTNGYYTVSLKRDGKYRPCRFCRVVAEAFIENPESKPNVDHINSNSLDDRPENLRWVTQKENMNNQKTISKMTGIKGDPVFQYTKEGDFIKEYKNAFMAARENGWTRANGIRRCCDKLKTYKLYKGFIWKYKKDVAPSKRYKKLEDIDYYIINGNSKPVVQLSLEGEFIKEWQSALHARKITGVTCIDRCCRGMYKQGGGYIWKYKEDVPKNILRQKIENVDYHKIVKVPRAIIQFSLEDTIIREWPCINNASKELGIPYCGIRDCCNGKKNEYRGYIWKYKDTFYLKNKYYNEEDEI